MTERRPEGPKPEIRERKEAGGKLALVLGDNASGKSFFRRVIETEASSKGKFPAGVIVSSMEHRTGGNLDLSPFERGMMYGTENDQATSFNSAQILDSFIRTAQSRTRNTIVYFDEPEIGMGNRAATGAGIAIREFVEHLPDHIQSVFVTSHSPSLIHELRKSKEEPHYIFLGNNVGPTSTDEWVERERSVDIAPLSYDDIKKETDKRFNDIRSVLKTLKK